MNLKPLYQKFAQNSDDKIALWMYNYMRKQFEFYGIKQPLRHKIQKEFWNEYGYPNIQDLDIILRKLWQHPKREAQYTAMDLIGEYINDLPMSFIDTLEWLIITKPWWDTVDILAFKYVNLLFTKYPSIEENTFVKWLYSDNIWLQRTSVIYQLRRKDKTDTEKLIRAITHLKNNKNFFIQKAIGWSLREYSKYNPDFVIYFVSSNELSSLSKREALRYLNKKNNQKNIA